MESFQATGGHVGGGSGVGSGLKGKSGGGGGGGRGCGGGGVGGSLGCGGGGCGEGCIEKNTCGIEKQNEGEDWLTKCKCKVRLWRKLPGRSWQVGKSLTSDDSLCGTMTWKRYSVFFNWSSSQIMMVMFNTLARGE